MGTECCLGLFASTRVGQDEKKHRVPTFGPALCSDVAETTGRATNHMHMQPFPTLEYHEVQ